MRRLSPPMILAAAAAMAASAPLPGGPPVEPNFDPAPFVPRKNGMRRGTKRPWGSREQERRRKQIERGMHTLGGEVSIRDPELRAAIRAQKRYRNLGSLTIDDLARVFRFFRRQNVVPCGDQYAEDHEKARQAHMCASSFTYSWRTLPADDPFPDRFPLGTRFCLCGHCEWKAPAGETSTPRKEASEVVVPGDPNTEERSGSVEGPPSGDPPRVTERRSAHT